jgi:hypothetical protein
VRAANIEGNAVVRLLIAINQEQFLAFVNGQIPL